MIAVRAPLPPVPWRPSPGPVPPGGRRELLEIPEEPVQPVVIRAQLGDHLPQFGELLGDHRERPPVLAGVVAWQRRAEGQAVGAQIPWRTALRRSRRRRRPGGPPVARGARCAPRPAGCRGRRGDRSPRNVRPCSSFDWLLHPVSPPARQGQADRPEAAMQSSTRRPPTSTLGAVAGRCAPAHGFEDQRARPVMIQRLDRPGGRVGGGGAWCRR